MTILYKHTSTETDLSKDVYGMSIISNKEGKATLFIFSQGIILIIKFSYTIDTGL